MAALPQGHEAALLHLSELHPEEDQHKIVREGIRAAIRDGTWVGQTTLLSRDGRRVPVRQIIIAHKSFQGTPEHLSIIMHDLTGLHEAERRIREQADVLNRARDAIIITDLAGRVTFWNQGAERVSGWQSGAVIGRSLDDLFGFVAHAEIVMAGKALRECR